MRANWQYGVRQALTGLALCLVLSVPSLAQVSERLLLEVIENGRNRQLLSRFLRTDNGLAVSAKEYQGLGFYLHSGIPTMDFEGEPWVLLDQISGLTYSINMRAQQIEFTAEPKLFEPQFVDARRAPPQVEPQGDWGALIGYDVIGSYNDDKDTGQSVKSMSAILEGRVFSPSGVARSFFLYAGGDGPDRFVRLNSFAEFNDVDDFRTLRLGDSVSRSLSWTSSLQYGGIQINRDFGLRPDFIPFQLASFSDEVALPSTVDVFVDGVRRFGSRVQPGPFTISDLPTNDGINNVDVVVTDQLGRERSINLPIYSAPTVLKKGLFDYSLEAGALRRRFSTRSFDYGRVFGSGTARYGITDAFTLEGHAEGADGVVMAGSGLNARLANLGTIQGFFAASRSRGETGYLYGGAIERRSQWFSIGARYEEVTTKFRDIAALEGAERPERQFVGRIGAATKSFGSFNVSYSHRDFRTERVDERFLSGSYNYHFKLGGRNISLFASGFKDFGESGDYGASINFSIQLGSRTHTRLGARRNNTDTTYTAEVTQGNGEGEWSWSFVADEGAQTFRSAEALWNGYKIDADLRAFEDDTQRTFQADLRGALVFADNSWFLADELDDGFAVIDTDGYEGVKVLRENQFVGETNKDGKLFVNRLRAYERNALSIDPTSVPIDVQIKDTSFIVAPRRAAGLTITVPVVVNSSAVVVVQDLEGNPIKAGARVRLEDTEFSTFVGYGGEIYLQELSKSKTFTVSNGQGQCRIKILETIERGTVPKVGPYVCDLK